MSFEIFSSAFFYLSNHIGLGICPTIIFTGSISALGFSLFSYNNVKKVEKSKFLFFELKQFEELNKSKSENNEKNLENFIKYNEFINKHHLKQSNLDIILKIPILSTFFFYLDKISMQILDFPQIQTDGLFWFSDLTLCDPYCILPISATFITMLNLIICKSELTSIRKTLSIFLIKNYPIITLPFGIFFPSALQLFWLSYSLTNLGILIFFRKILRKNRDDLIKGSIMELKLKQLKSNNLFNNNKI